QAHIAQELKALCNEDNSWFYCAQMLIVAQFQGIPIEEIAVRWEDDPADSKVKVFALSRTYLKQIWRLYRILHKK
ncbi:MAG: glycosyltransferase, partial [Helicobacter sp.]|nr:glycosyltransferase [Helicobacter sp.]